MSRVTIDSLADDYMNNVHYRVSDKISDVEIVPRKIVEMIIEHCLEDYKCMCESQGVDQYANGICVESKEIKQYAESLLKQFEDDEEDNI